MTCLVQGSESAVSHCNVCTIIMHVLKESPTTYDLLVCFSLNLVTFEAHLDEGEESEE